MIVESADYFAKDLIERLNEQLRSCAQTLQMGRCSNFDEYKYQVGRHQTLTSVVGLIDDMLKDKDDTKPPERTERKFG